MRLEPSDWILLGILTIVAPAYSYHAGTRIARGTMPGRLQAYLRTMLSWWLIALAMLFVWSRFGRALTLLGFALPHDFRSIAGATLCALFLVYMGRQFRAVRAIAPDRLNAIAERFGAVQAILPRTPGEYRWFIAVSVTAGICEELLYRGYFFAATSHALALPGAMLCSAAIFGIGHAYQGWRGVVRTGAVGLFFGIVYVATGSLLWPVVLHGLLDVQGGTLAFAVLRERAGNDQEISRQRP